MASKISTEMCIRDSYVRDIVEHPEKTYTTRLRNEGKLYDFVAVARQDASGILIAVSYTHLDVYKRQPQWFDCFYSSTITLII